MSSLRRIVALGKLDANAEAPWIGKRALWRLVSHLSALIIFPSSRGGKIAFQHISAALQLLQFHTIAEPDRRHHVTQELAPLCACDVRAWSERGTGCPSSHRTGRRAIRRCRCLSFCQRPGTLPRHVCLDEQLQPAGRVNSPEKGGNETMAATSRTIDTDLEEILLRDAPEGRAFSLPIFSSLVRLLHRLFPGRHNRRATSCTPRRKFVRFSVSSISCISAKRATLLRSLPR